MGEPRLPRIREVPVLLESPAAWIGGFAAYFLALALAEEIPGGIEGAIVRRGLSAEAAQRARFAVQALEAAAAAWQQLPLTPSPLPAREGHAVRADLDSAVWLSTNVAARQLDVSPRRTRQLGETGELRSRLRLGRREFAAADVAARLERRRGSGR